LILQQLSQVPAGLRAEYVCGLGKYNSLHEYDVLLSALGLRYTISN